MAYRGTPTSLVPKWEREFKSFQQWVDKAPTWIDKDAVCIDAKGRRCLIGADFQRARDEDAFPVRFFWECEESPELAGIASADAQDAWDLAARLMRRADNPPDPEVDVEELTRMLQTEEGRTAAFRMMQWAYQDRVDAANLLRAQKLHIDRVDAKLVATAAQFAPTHKHRNGGLYRVIVRGELEADLTPVVVYDSQDGRVWVRPSAQFDDGRFTALPTASDRTLSDPLARVDCGDGEWMPCMWYLALAAADHEDAGNFVTLKMIAASHGYAASYVKQEVPDELADASPREILEAVALPTDAPVEGDLVGRTMDEDGILNWFVTKVEG